MRSGSGIEISSGERDIAPYGTWPMRSQPAQPGDGLVQPNGRSGRRLSQRQCAISVGHNGFAVLAKGGVAAAVAHDAANLLALDIAVDAGHRRIDLGEQ